ncbi:MAG: hypothetical protein K2L97_03815 [Muribaculaceae bacterium]|nr:hypothetical protein [Muribaculaceae bacterium]
MIDERDLSRFLHTRACMMLMLVVACVLVTVAYLRGDVTELCDPVGIGVTPLTAWTGISPASLILSLAATASMGLIIIYLNRAFNVFRSLTSIVAGLFFIMQTALPSVMGRFYGGDVMGVLMLVNVVLLFSSWSDATSQRRIFLIFSLLSLAAFTDLAYLLYMPVFMLGCVQMRIFNLRTFLAAGMGVLTPPWILFGFGLVDISTLHIPPLMVAWSLFDNPEVIKALVVTGVTLALGVGFTVANLMKILSYNSRVRAFNGFLTLLLFATGAFAIINFNNFSFYIPLLNCMTAYQIAHFFTYRRSRRSYIPILLIIGLYIGFYVWAIS